MIPASNAEPALRYARLTHSTKAIRKWLLIRTPAFLAAFAFQNARRVPSARKMKLTKQPSNSMPKKQLNGRTLTTKTSVCLLNLRFFRRFFYENYRLDFYV